MGLFTQRPEEPAEWAGIPSEPARDETDAERLRAASVDPARLGPLDDSAAASIAIPIDAVTPPPSEESELDQAAAWLEQITRDPMADAVAGSVRVVAASEPQGRARYQECAVDLIADAAGVDAAAVATAVVLPRTVWPRVGDVLPARISVSDPQHLEVDWNALTRRR